jgi:GTP diphosphokinase / guanosine-3',5'-bis(diphosphate) 3'-diphosphatase
MTAAARSSVTSPVTAPSANSVSHPGPNPSAKTSALKPSSAKASTGAAPALAPEQALDPTALDPTAYNPIAYDIEVPAWLQACLDEHPQALCHIDRPTGTIDNETLICRAFRFAYCLHEGQKRASGEPYIAHPVAVAGILRELGGGNAVIAAGFLHDVVEDTEVTPEEIEARFGAEVRQLVEGVTKLGKLNFSSKTEQQAENFRRMFLAMAKDIRVILVKLADRLHNMRTLEHLPDSKRRRIAQETRDIFAPLANRLGIGHIKWELEDLAFKYIETEAYREIQAFINEKRADRESHIANAIAQLHDRLGQSSIQVIDINGRPKHLYSIYRKMRKQQKEFHEIFDIAALRIIVKNNEECYRSLAIVHDMFRPIPGRFKDYVGLPKPNQYQSLHTSVIGFSGLPLEVQIRTLEMHQIAEYGIAAHWKYKESGGSQAKLSTEDEKFTWLRQLLDWQHDVHDVRDAEEYLQTVKNNLFDEDVYVFTPTGDVIPLAQGATPIDFAYRIHSEVGNHCAGAKVNNRIVPLNTTLKSGDIVEILTQKNAHPSLDWVSFVATSSARNRIRQWLKRSHREANMVQGREMLERELGKKGLDSLLKSAMMQAIAERCNFPTSDDLLAGLGYGAITINQVVNRVREATLKNQAPAEAPDLPVSLQPNPNPNRNQPRSGKSPIHGVEGLVYRLAGCCTPLPGEPIAGAVSLGGHGISIHRQGCHALEDVPGDRLIPVSWNDGDTSNQRPTYPVRIQVEAIDRVGLMKDVLTRLCDHNINVRSAQVNTSPNRPAVIDVCVDIPDHEHLGRVLVHLKKMSDVLSARRCGEMGAS